MQISSNMQHCNLSHYFVTFSSSEIYYSNRFQLIRYIFYHDQRDECYSLLFDLWVWLSFLYIFRLTSTLCNWTSNSLPLQRTWDHPRVVFFFHHFLLTMTFCNWWFFCCPFGLLSPFYTQHETCIQIYSHATKYFIKRSWKTLPIIGNRKLLCKLMFSKSSP